MRGLLACLLVLFAQVFSALAGRTACMVRLASLMEEASLTCYFPEDISVSRKDFSVYHYNGKQRPVSVLDCMWVSGTLNCYSTRGYEYSRTVTNMATVRIPHVTANVTGRYTCQMSGSKQEDIEFCELFLNTGKTRCEIPSVEPQAMTNLTCYFPEDVSESRKNFAVYLFKDREISVAVVDCLWIVDSLTCAAQQGYQVVSKVSDRFTVSIPQALQSQTGIYLCGLSGYRPDSSLSCDLTLRYPDKISEVFEHPAATSTIVITVLAVATSLLCLWIVVCRCFRHRSCFQTVNKNPDEDSWESRIKICRMLNPCTMRVTRKTVNGPAFVLPQQRITAPPERRDAYNCPLVWRLLGRVPRNQDGAREEEEGTARALLTFNTEELCALGKVSQDKTETNGQGPTFEEDSGELQTAIPIYSTQVHADIVQQRLCQDTDTRDAAEEAIDSIKDKSTQQQKDEQTKHIKDWEKIRESSNAADERNSTGTDTNEEEENTANSSENVSTGDRRPQSETQMPTRVSEKKGNEYKTTFQPQMLPKMTSSELTSAPWESKLHMEPSENTEMSRHAAPTLQEDKERGCSSKRKVTKRDALRKTSNKRTSQKEKDDKHLSPEVCEDIIVGLPNRVPDDYDSDETTNAHAGDEKAQQQCKKKRTQPSAWRKQNRSFKSNI